MAFIYRLVSLMALLGLTGVATCAQGKCPTIHVEGTVGIPAPGELLSYSVVITPEEKVVGLTYLWSVSSRLGVVNMVRGQGTTSILVPWGEEYITATVTVFGLPEGCPNTSALTAFHDSPPVATKLNEFLGPISKIPGSSFIQINKIFKQNPSASLYVIVAGGRSGSVSEKVAALKKRLDLKNGSDTYEAIFKGSDRNDDRVLIWLVPAGADRPLR